MLATMTSTVQHAALIDSALTEWSRSKSSNVSAAYSAIMGMERNELGCEPTPNTHVFWIRGLSHGVGVHVVPRTRFHEFAVQVHNGEVADALDADDVAFDFAEHMIVTTQPTVLSYLVSTPFADKVPILGSGAMGMAHNFKCCAVWWNA